MTEKVIKHVSFLGTTSAIRPVPSVKEGMVVPFFFKYFMTLQNSFGFLDALSIAVVLFLALLYLQLSTIDFMTNPQLLAE